MPFLTQIDSLKLYTELSEIVDYNHPAITEKSLEFKEADLDTLKLVETVYHFVRDEIFHSMDIGNQKVTFKASKVLENGHGICFAKSNLLAAFLRSLEVPTGFCYQKLSHEGGFILHGLNAAFINNKWVRMDARGNREGVDAQFSMDKEILAFYPKQKGEKDYPGVYSQPIPFVVDAFAGSGNVQEVYGKISCNL